MNKLSVMTDGAIITSLDISVITGKKHIHVKRDIERMCLQLELDVSTLGCIYFDSLNRRQTEYRLDRRHAECLIIGYRADLRMKVIDRMRDLERELEKQKPAAIPDFTDPVAAARAWADAMEGKQKLEVVLQATTSYYDVLRVIKANPSAKLNARSCWRPLKKWCIENGKQMEKVYCPRFGEVNAYPREAWLAVYPYAVLPNEAGELVRLKLN